MMRIRKADDRGHADHGWLKTFYTFSFSSYRDPAHVHFRGLRVMNEDWIAPGQGFGEHPHDNMEIVTYVLSGALEHRDSMGNGEVLRPGEFQRMSAGTGITHSEFNPSATEPTHLYQIWIFPEKKGITPSYEQKRFAESERLNRLRLVASPDGAEGSLHVNADVRIYLSTLQASQSVSLTIADRRHVWLQVLSGNITVREENLYSGDGAALSDETVIDIHATADSEILIFDLA